MERLEEQNMLASYTVQHRRNDDTRNDNPFGFVVKDAPWNQQQQQKQQAKVQQQRPPSEYEADVGNTADFPSLGGKDGNKQQGQAWGPWSAQ